MDALVTGGAGFIGSNLCRRLAADGWRVTALDDLSTGHAASLEDAGVEVVRGSILDADLVASAAAGKDVVFHQAALPSVPRSFEDPAATLRVNSEGTAVVLEACRRADVPRFVAASSSSVYGDAEESPKHEGLPRRCKSPYALSKANVEDLASIFEATYGIRCTALRYFNVYGPRQDPNSAYAAVVPRFIAAVAAGEAMPVFGDGTQSRDFTFVDDVVRANVAAATADASGVYNVAGGRRVTVQELAEAVAAGMGAAARVVYLPPRTGDILHSLAAVDKARRELGFEARVPIEEGLRRTIAWFRSQPATASA